MKYLITLMCGLLLTGLSACGSKAAKSMEQSEETTAMIEAAMIEGRNTAKAFATKQWKDTLELQRHLLEAKSVQSKYVINKQPKCAAAFDSTFVSTMKTVRPDLASHLAAHYK